MPPQKPQILLILALVAAVLAIGQMPARAQVRGEFLITNYGAIGDGNFDNAPIINDLINRIPNTGGSIVIPHGNFRINWPIIVRKSYVTIRGLGRGSKILVGPGIREGIWVPDEGPRISGIVIRDLSISGLDWGIYQTGIVIERPNDGTHIANVACFDINRGIFVRAFDAGRITGCFLTRCESALLIVHSIVPVVTRNHFSAFSGGIAVEFAGGDRVQFTGNTIMPDGFTALWLRGISHCNISGNTITTIYTGAIEVEGDMNNLSGNNITALPVNGSWLPDPRGRDGHYGLVRINGNDNTFMSSTIISWQPENDVRVNVLGGGSIRLRDLNIAGVPSNRKVNVLPGANGRITHCGWPHETQLNGNGDFHAAYDP